MDPWFYSFIHKNKIFFIKQPLKCIKSYTNKYNRKQTKNYNSRFYFMIKYNSDS